MGNGNLGAFMNQTKRISVIIPCYNEEQVLEETYKRLKGVMINCHYTNYELIFINDGSFDNTLELLKAIAAKDSNVIIINFSRNFGHQPAVSAGIHICSGDLAIIIDADLQDPPELIPEMIKKYDEGFNVVYGVRSERKGEGSFKKLSAKLFYRTLNRFSEIKFPLDTGDFRLIDRKIMDHYKELKEKNKYIRGLISWLGFKQTAFFYQRENRFAGSSKYPLKKMMQFATTGLLYFSKKPLKIALNIGFSSIILSFLLIFYALFSKFFLPKETVPGWTSTLIIILFLGGVQLFTIGIMGEYIGDIFDEIKSRPEYVVDEIISSGTNIIKGKLTESSPTS